MPGPPIVSNQAQGNSCKCNIEGFYSCALFSPRNLQSPKRSTVLILADDFARDADFPTLANPSNQAQSLQFATNAWSKPIPSEQSQRQQRQQRLSSEQSSSRAQRLADSEDLFPSSTTGSQISGSRQPQTMNSASGSEPSRRSSMFLNDGYQSSGFGSRMIPPGMESQQEADARDPSRLTSPSTMSQGCKS
jgi:hypothetical protein